MTPDEIISADTNLTLLKQAIVTETPISFRYWKPEDWERKDRTGELPKRRTVSPYELRDGGDAENVKTLLICWSHEDEGVRSFDTDRIGGVRSEEGVEEFVFPVEA
jgi:predicted DNA-binding transcriptional regulator YafY